MAFRLFANRHAAGYAGMAAVAAFGGGAAFVAGGNDNDTLKLQKSKHLPSSFLSPFVPVAQAESAASGATNTKRKERLVVLGSGWGAVALVKNIDPALYDVTLVSPRNYFLNTPLLPGVTVGTVEARSVIEPVRRLLPGKPGEVKFYEAAATAVDLKARTVTCRDDSDVVVAGAQEFTLPYDKLVAGLYKLNAS
jgi:hypothetical protein